MSPHLIGWKRQIQSQQEAWTSTHLTSSVNNTQRNDGGDGERERDLQWVSELLKHIFIIIILILTSALEMSGCSKEREMSQIFYWSVLWRRALGTAAHAYITHDKWHDWIILLYGPLLKRSPFWIWTVFLIDIFKHRLKLLYLRSIIW